MTVIASTVPTSVRALERFADSIPMHCESRAFALLLQTLRASCALFTQVHACTFTLVQGDAAEPQFQAAV